MKAIGARTREAVAEITLLAREEGVRYGAEGLASWLPSTVSIAVDSTELNAFEIDLAHAWRWYEAWTALYLDSLAGRADAWIAELVEHGLAAHEIEINRSTAAAGLRPLTCRLEYMYQGGQRLIAEVQWVSGGLGFFSGIDSLYRRTARLEVTQQLGPLNLELIRVLAEGAAERGDVLTAVRDDWLPGELFLARQAAAAGAGVRFRTVERRQCATVLSDPQLPPVGLLYGQGYTSLLPECTLRALSRKALTGGLWAEAPYNYVYRQKWGLAMLHDPRFAARFPEALRCVTPVTILLNARRPQFELIGAARPAFEPLSRADKLSDVLSLPERARSQLVVKCGAGTGGFHSNGRGVFRLSGSRGSAQRTLAFVEARMRLGEPWIMQPFSSSALDLPFITDTHTEGGAAKKSHLKVMTFGVWNPSAARPRLAGALASYRHHWKVGGKSPGIDSSGNEIGACFTDVVLSTTSSGQN